jgi:hypothetical protein
MTGFGAEKSAAVNGIVMKVVDKTNATATTRLKSLLNMKWFPPWHNRPDTLVNITVMVLEKSSRS